MYKILFTLVFAFIGCCSLVAQEAAIENLELKSFTDDKQGSIFIDAEEKICYVDFQSLNVNLDAILIKDESGEVVKDEKVFDLPVDTIYELDLSDLKSGEYAIELRSFGKIITQEVTVK